MDNWNTSKYLHQCLIKLVEKIYLEKSYIKAIEIIKDIAYEESTYYFGYLSSIQLEIMLLKIAKDTLPKENFKAKSIPTRKVLHIASELYSVGGHTRVLSDWIKYDIESNSEILITRQKSKIKLPISSKTTLIEKEDSLSKAKEIRKFLSKNYFDVIILHQHMDDVIPTLALWDFKEKSTSKIFFYNHANFQFSIGNIIAHKRINFSIGDTEISEQHRTPIDDLTLPFVIGEKLDFVKDKLESTKLKKELNIKDDVTIFLTIGSAYKYEPYKKLNFFDEWNTFLTNTPNAVLISVGCDEHIFNQYCPNSIRAENLILLGIVTNPIKYYSLSNYIVDIYPLQTGLGMIQGLYYQLPPILPYSESPYVMGDKINTLYPNELRKLLTYNSKKAYFDFINNEIITRQYKTASIPLLNNYISENLLAKSWRRQLYSIYDAPVFSNQIKKQKDKRVNTRESFNYFSKKSTRTSKFVLFKIYFKYKGSINFKLILFYLLHIIKYQRLYGIRLFFRYIINFK